MQIRGLLLLPVLAVFMQGVPHAAIANAAVHVADGTEDSSASEADPTPVSSLRDDESGAVAKQELIGLARARAEALAAHNCQVWAKYVDTNFRFIEGSSITNRGELVKDCQTSSRPDRYREERVLSDFHVQWIGNTAVLDCLYQTIEHFGDIVFTETVRHISTYEKQGSGWIAMLAVSVPIPQDPPPAKPDLVGLDMFTGRYAWVRDAAFEDSVTLRNNKLYVQGPGDKEATELIPQGSDIFFVHGSAADRITFLRDKQGKVIAEDLRGPDGQGYRAAKVN